MVRYYLIIPLVALLLTFTAHQASAQVTFSLTSGNVVDVSTGYAQVNLQIVNNIPNLSSFTCPVTFTNKFGSRIFDLYITSGGRGPKGELGENDNIFTTPWQVLDSNFLTWRKQDKLWRPDCCTISTNVKAYTIMEIYGRFALPSPLTCGDFITVTVGNIVLTTNDGKQVYPTNGPLSIDIQFGTAPNAVTEKPEQNILPPTTLEQLQTWQQQHPTGQIKLYNFLAQEQDMNNLNNLTDGFYLYTIQEDGQITKGKIIYLR